MRTEEGEQLMKISLDGKENTVPRSNKSMCGETLKRGDKIQNHSEKSTVRMEARMEAKRPLMR